VLPLKPDTCHVCHACHASAAGVPLLLLLHCAFAACRTGARGEDICAVKVTSTVRLRIAGVNGSSADDKNCWLRIWEQHTKRSAHLQVKLLQLLSVASAVALLYGVEVSSLYQCGGWGSSAETSTAGCTSGSSTQSGVHTCRWREPLRQLLCCMVLMSQVCTVLVCSIR
jgi:hypothetical protein